MHLRIKTLALNDSRPSSPAGSVEPAAQEVADAVVLLWRQEPQTVVLTLQELHPRIMAGHPEWNLPLTTFVALAKQQNLVQSRSNRMFLYESEVQFPQISSERFYELSQLKRNRDCVEIAQKPSEAPHGNRSLIAKRAFAHGDQIAYDLAPICQIPPMEKLVLMSLGKACSCCGKSISSSNISPHFIMTNGLDCDGCSAVWCSKTCRKTQFAIHAALKHNRYKQQQRVCTRHWNEFEQYCQKYVLVAAYAVAQITAYALITGNRHLEEQFNALAAVSQRIRIRASDTTNIGGTLDMSSGAMSSSKHSESPKEVWTRAYELYSQVFPETLTREEPVTYDLFLDYVGRFNINQLSTQQLYFTLAFANHNCEPNAHFEVDQRGEMKLMARKPIAAGDEIFITYVNPLHEVHLRQRELRVNYGFLCGCSRCKSELEAPAPKPVVMVSPSENSQASTSPSATASGAAARRKSSMRSQRPDLSELLKNGQEFDLEIPEHPAIGARRRTSVRFDGNVSMAVEEE